MVGAQKTQAASLYTPFGGSIEEYIPQSEAQCVKNSCGKLNEPVQKAVKELIAAPRDAICSSVSALCTFIPLIGNIACYAACVEAINQAVEDSINVCSVEEIRVGPPRPASVGILRVGELTINVGVRVPPIVGPRINITSFKLNLGQLLTGVFDFIPDAKIYKHGEYKKEGNWVIGDSLNLLNACGLGKSDKEMPAVCKNVVAKAVISVLNVGQKEAGEAAYKEAIGRGVPEEEAQQIRKEAELDYARSCPFLNLLRQIGTSRSS